MNVSFSYGNETVQFDSNGNPPGWYDIMNYQQRAVSKGQQQLSYGYVQIGSWKNGTLDVPDWPAKMVTSVCSEPCQNGQIKVSLVESFSTDTIIGDLIVNDLNRLAMILI